MWDYDKLFAEGNIIGISPTKNEVINLVCSKFNHNIDGFRNLYSNNDLSYKNIKIQYIIRLDEHGDVVEKLFDRDQDMANPMPELKTGMFIKLKKYEEIKMGFVYAEENHVIYQEGGYDFIYEDEIMGNGIVADIVEVYSEDACAFEYCDEDVLIWRSPEYQAYLDSKN